MDDFTPVRPHWQTVIPSTSGWRVAAGPGASADPLLIARDDNGHVVMGVEGDLPNDTSIVFAVRTAQFYPPRVHEEPVEGLPDRLRVSSSTAGDWHELVVEVLCPFSGVLQVCADRLANALPSSGELMLSMRLRI